MSIVDLAGGTGDISFRMIDALSSQRKIVGSAESAIDTHVTVCDINAEMLQEGRRRAKNDRPAVVDGISLQWVQGDAENLPFPDGSVDAVTIAFGLRNVSRTWKALSEINRILTKGGRFLCMEFSQVKDPLLRQAYDAYSFNVIPAMGGFLAGDPQPYQYLVESIRQFHDQETLADLMRDAGMKHVTYKNILGGVVAIHSGFRL